MCLGTNQDVRQFLGQGTFPKIGCYSQWRIQTLSWGGGGGVGGAVLIYVSCWLFSLLSFLPKIRGAPPLNSLLTPGKRKFKDHIFVHVQLQ